MLKEAYEEAKRLLSEHRKTLDKISDFLIQKETITGKEFMEIFHEAEGMDPEKSGEKAQERIIMLPVDTEESEIVQETEEQEENATVAEE